MSEIYVTADLHFGHKRMAEHWRGFKQTSSLSTVEAMNYVLISRWNDIIHPKDEVYVLGDFSFMNRSRTEEVFNALNGRKYLIRGNHDGPPVINQGWENQWDFRRLKVNGQSIYMMHYPMLTWPNAHKGTLHIHGHSHGNLQGPQSTRMDVGIDATNMIALSVDQVVEMMKDLQYDFIDHHREE
jgi:calcineurin-like phosphoesterase family protein